MGDEENGAVAAEPLDGVGHELGRLRVEVCRRLVEDDERRVAQERAGQGDPAPSFLAETGRPPSPTTVS